MGDCPTAFSSTYMVGHSFLFNINFCFLYSAKIELFRQFVWVTVLLVMSSYSRLWPYGM